MSAIDSWHDRRTTYVFLWAVAVLCFGLAVTETAVLGLTQSQLLLLATVFAAVTAEYTRRGRTCGSRQDS